MNELRKASTTKHTPGPWKRVANSIKSRKADCVIVRLPALTDCVGDEAPEQIERWDADARLIAAAPDLYEACQLVMDSDDAAVRDVVRAAMAKARGEQR